MTKLNIFTSHRWGELDDKTKEAGDHKFQLSEVLWQTNYNSTSVPVKTIPTKDGIRFIYEEDELVTDEQYIAKNKEYHDWLDEYRIEEYWIHEWEFCHKEMFENYLNPELRKQIQNEAQAFFWKFEGFDPDQLV